MHRWLRVLVATVVALLAGGGLAPCPATYAYDAPTIARVDVPASEGAEAGSVQLSDAGRVSVSPSVEPRGASTISSGSVVATEAAAGVDTGLVHGPPLGRPNFIASSNGEIVAVPDGAVGPTMADSGNGIQFTGGSGGRGLDPRVTDIRVMDPVTTGKYTSPDGYVSYSNAAGQTVSPVTGQTIGKSDPLWHWQWGPK